MTSQVLTAVFKKMFLVPLLLLVGLANSASATIVQFQTVMGNFEVNLYDKATPITVKNFLDYVNSGAYKNTIIHRSVPGFVIQGGGYQYDAVSFLITTSQKAAITNEPVFSNKRGTIAMAKTSGNLNSATNQWFFNLVDNSKDLDGLDSLGGGQFTVFGEITNATGLSIMDSIAGISLFNFGGAFTSVPLRNFTAADAAAGTVQTDKNFVIITNILVLDANVDSAANLTPVKNTASSGSGASGSGSSGGSGGSSGGGAINILMLLVLSVVSLRFFK